MITDSQANGNAPQSDLLFWSGKIAAEKKNLRNAFMAFLRALGICSNRAVPVLK